MEKTTTPAQRATEVLTSTGQPFDLVDALKQEFHTQRQAASQQHEVGKVVSARLHYGMAAVLANVLSRYYQADGNEILAEAWAHRAIRLHRLAFQQRNRIAENIGATDHDR